MTLRRRDVGFAGLAAAGWTATARAQGVDTWPNRPVRIVVPSAPAGSADTVARSLVERLGNQTGKSFFVENRAGLAGTIGTDHVAKSAPDGYTFIFISTNQAVNETLQPRRPYVLLRDLAPVAAINSLDLIFAITPDLPAHNLAEFIAHAKANPGVMNFASSGPGSLFHLSSEVFRAVAGLDMQHIPFRNYSEARTQTMSGQIQLMADAEFTLEPLIRSGRMRAIATTGASRSRLFPDVPTIAESFPGYEFALWNGLLAPAGTPRAVIDRMNAEVNKVLVEPAFAEQGVRMGMVFTPGTPESWGSHIARETDRMREAVRVAAIAPE